MTKGDVGASFDIALDLLPVILVVADFLAVGTDWQQTLEVFFARYRFFELAHPIGEGHLQIEDALADLNPRLQFLAVEGLIEVVVGAGGERFGDVVLGVAGG